MNEIKKIQILYVSNLCSENVINFLFKTSNTKPAQEAQKFHRLIVEGFGMHPDLCKVHTLSGIPLLLSNYKRKIWNLSSEKVSNVSFNYVPQINIPFLRDIVSFVYSFFWILKWFRLNKGKKKVIICDTLKFSLSSSAILASKLSKEIVVGIVTDLPDLLVGSNKKRSFKYKIYKRVSYFTMFNFNKYIILTAQMNEIVNPNSKPFLIMEGLVDINMKNKINSLKEKDLKRILLYAGGLYEEYGIKTLLEAFMKLKGDNICLHIFGPGEMENEMPKYMKLDKRIVYKGIVPNSEVIDYELQATLLINPRLTKNDFTKFSFPSKNMEYMASGTPTVTTKLPGMPLEYYRYVYLFEDESVEGMANTLKELMVLSDNELFAFGRNAQQFVLKNKSNLIQSKRILDFLNN